MAHHVVNVRECDLCKHRVEGVLDLPKDWARLRIPVLKVVVVSQGKGRKGIKQKQLVPTQVDVCPTCIETIGHAGIQCLPEEERAKLSEEMLSR